MKSMDENVYRPLLGVHVRLGTLEPSHYNQLRRMELAEALVARWRFQGASPTPEEYASWLGEIF